MPFAEIRKEMRDSQNLLYHNAQDRNEDKGSEIISFKKPHKISQVKMNHLNKVAPTASPLLAKTPKRVNNHISYIPWNPLKLNTVASLSTEFIMSSICLKLLLDATNIG